jgi:poly(beta-D-mannuronate) lyase
MSTNKLLFTIALLLTSTLGFSQVVTTPAQLTNAINSATPGTTIILADGTWNDVFIDIDKNGTAAAPITITAQNSGAVLMTGNSRVYMEGSYITVSGLVFQNASNLVVNGSTIEPVFELKDCDYCKVINNKIDGYNGTEAQKTLKFKWILTDGQYNEIAYNSFIGKYGVGSIINDNRNSIASDYLKIHHNYFADRTPINGVNDDNDQDAIRLGNSSTSLDNSNSEVYDNYFHNFFGEIEIISNKSGQNKYYNNTFRKYSGCLTLRHGDDCEVYGNYFFAENNTFSAGIRVIGEGHKVYNNYIEGVNSTKPDGSTSNATGGINVSNGRLNSAVNGYYQVKNAEIVNNTFVNCDYALRIGTQVSSDLDQEPINLTVANNIMYNTSIDPYQTVTAPSGTSPVQGNMTNLAMTDMVDDGYFHRLTSTSAPIDSGIGSYSFLTQDILDGPRGAIFDAGAEEFGANGTRLPYDSLDVGVNVGFGAIENVLDVAASSINFGRYAGTITFDIVSNVGWTITENISWLSLDITSGSGTTTITATLTENTTGFNRTGDITFDEVAGGSGLSDLLTIVQLNTYQPSEITIVGTSTIGMQIKPEVSELNAYDDDLGTYWTGDPDTEPEVSITFDLACLHPLNDIGIHFWKADIRTTTFSISVSNDSLGPFTTVLNNVTSAIATVETEQLFDLTGTITRYVKFTGIGNSSSSNWTSIANVNIYGNSECDSTTSVFNNQPIDQSITVFPVPATDEITIQSDKTPLGNIQIYNVTGMLVLTTNGNRSYSKQVDVTELNTGVYFIKIEGVGQAIKFVKQ